MKKRIALAAAIALAISVGGMVPASAKLAAPVVTASSCARAGGTLELKAKDGNITVDLKGTVGEVNVTWTGTVDSFVGESACSPSPAAALTLTGLTSIVVSATEETGGATGGNVSIDLEGLTPGTLANYASIPMTIRADGTLKFDGSLLTDSGHELRPVIGTATEDTFTLGSVTGSYYAGRLNFAGGNAADSFDASAVTTTPVTATGGAGNDVLKGGALGDILTPETGDDVAYGNAGADTIDTSADVTGGSCTPFPPKNKAKPEGSCKTSTPGVSGADEAWGGLGNDTITADAADIVAPGDGIDLILGAAYQLNYGDSSAAITLDVKAAGGLVKSTAGDDYYPAGSVGQFVGSPFADTMKGGDSTSAVDVFYGGDGADILVGNDGGDFLSGNGGTDVIKGGKGADTILGDTAADKMIGGADDDLILMGGGDDIAYGSTGDDTLRGQKGSDQAWGGRGTFDVCAAEVTDSCEFKK